MSVDEKRAFALMEKLGFERVSGSEAEARAARMLCEEAASFGVTCALEPFEVEDGEATKAELEVLSPYRQVYPVTGYLRSDSTPPEGMEADFAYVEDGLPANLTDVRGKAVLVNRRPGYRVYEALKGAGAGAVITFSGDYQDDPGRTDHGQWKLRPMLTEAFGGTVAVNLRCADAMDIVRRGARRVRLVVESKKITRTSHNVCAVLPGSEKPEEEIVFGAHYDSVFFSRGMYDNGAGSVSIMELMRHFAAHPPRRTLRFCWFGSEEQGLLGAKAYTAQHDLKNVRLMFNLDVGGPVLGRNCAFVTGEKSAVAYVDGVLKEAGYAFETRQSIQSSDSVPFADRDVPAINLFRGAAAGAGEMHTRRDDGAFLSPEGLGAILHPALLLAEKMVNGAVIPVETTVPAEMHEEIDKYLFRKK